MATKSVMIKYIEDHSGETESWGDLNRMKKSEVEQIYEYLMKIEEQQTTTIAEGGEEYTQILSNDPLLGGGIEYGEDYVEDPTIEKTLVEKSPSTVIFGDVEETEEEVEEEKKLSPQEMQEYVEFKKPSELSISEQRAYARTGVLPVKKK